MVGLDRLNPQQTASAETAGAAEEPCGPDRSNCYFLW